MKSAANRRARKSKSRSSSRRPRIRRVLPGMALPVGFLKPNPIPALGFGVSPRAGKLRNLVLHIPTGYMVDVAEGHVYGRTGQLIGSRAPGEYVRVAGVSGMASTLYAHRLVWECVYGPIPEGHHIDHKNARRDDNRCRNLQAVTPSRNRALVFERGGGVVGEDVGNAKLTEEKVRQMRSKRLSHLTAGELGRLFGVHPTTAHAARIGKTWKHVRRRRPGPGRGKRQD